MPDFKAMAAAAADKFGIPQDIFHNLVGAESSFNPNAQSPAGAMGLTQLMPATAKGLGVTNILDPQQNLEGGARYLRQQIDHFGKLSSALAAYNAGPGAVEKYGGVPPFKETQAYVNKILGRSGGQMSARPQQQSALAQMQQQGQLPTIQNFNTKPWLSADQNLLNQMPQAANQSYLAAPNQAPDATPLNLPPVTPHLANEFDTRNAEGLKSVLASAGYGPTTPADQAKLDHQHRIKDLIGGGIGLIGGALIGGPVGAIAGAGIGAGLAQAKFNKTQTLLTAAQNSKKAELIEKYLDYAPKNEEQRLNYQNGDDVGRVAGVDIGPVAIGDKLNVLQGFSRPVIAQQVAAYTAQKKDYDYNASRIKNSSLSGTQKLEALMKLGPEPAYPQFRANATMSSDDFKTALEPTAKSPGGDEARIDAEQPYKNAATLAGAISNISSGANSLAQAGTTAPVAASSVYKAANDVRQKDAEIKIQQGTLDATIAKIRQEAKVKGEHTSFADLTARMYKEGKLNDADMKNILQHTGMMGVMMNGGMPAPASSSGGTDAPGL